MEAGATGSRPPPPFVHCFVSVRTVTWLDWAATLFAMEGSTRRDAVRRSYDAVAEKCAIGFREEIAYKPLDRALLSCVVEQTEEGAPIADLGCGPGHVAAWLADLGARTVGIDLSARMVDIGRKEYPEIEAHLERKNHPEELVTDRTYLLARAFSKN